MWKACSSRCKEGARAYTPASALLLACMLQYMKGITCQGGELARTCWSAAAGGACLMHAEAAAGLFQGPGRIF